MKKKVLVIGGAGYIGSVLQQSGQHEYIPFDLKNGDDARAGLFTALECRPDVVVDLAAWKRVDEGQRDPGKYFHNNTLIPLQVARFATILDIPIIYTSSAAVYGNTVYGLTKSIGEAVYHDSTQDVVIMRLQNVYGEGGGGVVDIIRGCKVNGKPFVINGGDYPTDDGTAARDYVHVEDVAAVINAYIEDPIPCLFDFGTGSMTTVKQLADTAGICYTIGEERSGDVAACAARYTENPLDIKPARKVEDYLGS